VYATISIHDTWTRAHRAEYGEDWASLRWAEPAELLAASAWRDEQLDWLARQAHLDCAETKPHVGPLAPGCTHCVAGGWSCLFVNGRCNGSCFFCPAPQDSEDQPATSAVTFARSADYLAYVEATGVTGVGLSGGEPLLTPQRTLALARALSSRPGPRLHLWLYTNGLLLTPELAAQLRDAGVDEIRLDLAASGYDLEILRTARRFIPTVTIEIPAVPEHEPRLRLAMATWKDEGLDFLNLHQLRCTPHNRRHLVARGYTFLPGPKVTVLESERCALQLLRHAAEHVPGLPVHYCSFPYKQRFQALAARRRTGRLVRQPWEELTDAGYLRTLSLLGPDPVLEELAQRLSGRPGLEGAWSAIPSEGRLHLPARALAEVDPAGLSLRASYVETVLRESITYRHPFRALKLDTGRTLWIERRRVARDLVAALAEPCAAGAVWEQLERGLSPYQAPSPVRPSAPCRGDGEAGGDG
jgi:pyruvate formate-lyase activating enzyme-like uncharacterized protein